MARVAQVERRFDSRATAEMQVIGKELRLWPLRGVRIGLNELARLQQPIEFGGRERPQVFNCFLGLGRGRENGLGIVAKHLQPPGDVCGVIGSRLVRDSERSAQKRRSQFCNQFFERIGVIAEASAELPVTAMRGTCPMRLMPISA